MNWIEVLLIGGYIALQLIADVTAVKITTIWGFAIPAATFVYALTFTWRDLLHRRLGRETARATVLVAGLCNVFMAGYFWFAVRLPSAVFWSGQEAFRGTLDIVWRITLASIVAEVVSQWLDTEVYHFLSRRAGRLWRVLVSNGISLPVDSVLFCFLAFSGTMPVEAVWSIVLGQIILKGVITVASVPIIYLLPR